MKKYEKAQLKVLNLNLDVITTSGAGELDADNAIDLTDISIKNV